MRVALCAGRVHESIEPAATARSLDAGGEHAAGRNALPTVPAHLAVVLALADGQGIAGKPLFDPQAFETGLFFELIRAGTFPPYFRRQLSVRRGTTSLGGKVMVAGRRSKTVAFASDPCTHDVRSTCDRIGDASNKLCPHFAPSLMQGRLRRRK